MEALNLSALSNIRDQASREQSMQMLTKLAMQNDGPLRVTEDKGNIHLGVRSWPTYFFEKVFFWKCATSDAKLETVKAIEKYARSFIENSNSMLAENAVPSTAWSELISRVSSKPVYKEKLPTPEAKPSTPEANLSTPKAKPSTPEAKPSTPEAKPPKTDLEKLIYVKYKGGCCVGRGISGFIFNNPSQSPLEMIADVRLVRKETAKKPSPKQERKGYIKILSKIKLDEPKASDDPAKYYERCYEKYYFSHLYELAGQVKSTVVLELVHDHNDGCSDDNETGAGRAAKAFIQFMNDHHGKIVSVMLIKPKQPNAAK